eukprot:Lankesteria_metandrocarpae@DN10580_c0_g1_i1.p1
MALSHQHAIMLYYFILHISRVVVVQLELWELSNALMPRQIIHIDCMAYVVGFVERQKVYIKRYIFNVPTPLVNISWFVGPDVFTFIQMPIGLIIGSAVFCTHYCTQLHSTPAPYRITVRSLISVVHKSSVHALRMCQNDVWMPRVLQNCEPMNNSCFAALSLLSC